MSSNLIAALHQFLTPAPNCLIEIKITPSGNLLILMTPPAYFAHPPHK